MRYFRRRRESLPLSPWSARRRSLKPEATLLEDRRLLSIGTITATVTPQILPNVGRFIPVTVSGTIQQGIPGTVPGNPATKPGPAVLAPIDAHNATQPAPGKAMIQVVDQYRADEPILLPPLSQISANNFYLPRTKYTPAAEDLVRTFSFSSTFYLQAKLGTYSHGRQYVLFVSATDQSGPAVKDLFAFVPYLGRSKTAHRTGAAAGRRK